MALLKALLMVDQISLIWTLVEVIIATAHTTIKESNRLYSTMSWASSSCQNALRNNFICSGTVPIRSIVKYSQPL